MNKRKENQNLKIRRILDKKILQLVLEKERYREILKETKEITQKLIAASKKTKLSVFIGGSMAKKTMLNKEKMDVDLFVRFENNKDLQKFSQIMKMTKEEYSLVHGSRDYAQIQRKRILFEIIPTIKVSNPKKAENITDLSYFHVNYVRKKINAKPKLSEEIILAKAFAHGAGCYGAESYIQGFSGYSIELLIIHYGSFTKFIKIMADYEGKKVVIDTEGYYKGKNALVEINESKLHSPIVLVDPTYKERNALAALSNETLQKFRKHSQAFLRNPSEKYFEPRTINEEELRKKALVQKKDFGIITFTTQKQSGDIAGTKLLKFSKVLAEKLEEYFKNASTEFEYDQKQTAKLYFLAKPINKKIIRGPPVKMSEHSEKFRKEHKKTYLKNGRLYTEIKLDYKIQRALKEIQKKYPNLMKEMGIVELKLKS